MTVLTLLTLGGSALAAQEFWHPELGVQGGFASIKPSGTGQRDAMGLINFPGGVFVTGAVSYGAIYGIIPLGTKLALEPSFNASQITTPGLSLTTSHIGLRANYAFGEHLYGAAGLGLNFIEASGTSEAQFALQTAVGYRVALSATLNGRAEAQYATSANSDNLAPTNMYALLLGVSARLDGGAPAASGGRSAATNRAWRPALGVQGGYTRTHIVNGGGDVVSLAFPGVGGNLTSAGLPFTGPATLFVIFPVGNKFAIEPGLDIHRTQEGGQTIASVNLGARLNYAVAGGWYAAAGLSFTNIHATGADNATLAGGNLAWGYRFPMTGPFGGRAEINYNMVDDNSSLGIPPMNTLGLMLGLMMALK